MTMTEIEAKALALVNTHAINRRSDLGDAKHTELRCALLDAVQSQAATEARHAAELREQAERFSEAVDAYGRLWSKRTPSRDEYNTHFAPFIITAPDPLVEAMADCGVDRFESWADQLHAALAARGYEVRKIEHTPPAGGSDAE